MDRSAEVLKVLAPKAPKAAAVAEDFFARQEQIRREKYQPDREKEKVAAAADETTNALAAAEREVLAAIDVEETADLNAYEGTRATADRAHRSLSDVIDVTQLRSSDSPQEILELVRRADAAGAGGDARAAAITRMKVLAAAEARSHIQSGPAFAALVRLSSQPAGRPADAADIVARYAEKRRQARAAVVEIARVCGLAERLARSAVAAQWPLLRSRKAR